VVYRRYEEDTLISALDISVSALKAAVEIYSLGSEKYYLGSILCLNLRVVGTLFPTVV
jgi:hypothetical protein